MAEEWVYFIRCPANGLIRIGWTTKHPDARLKRLAVTSPVPLEAIASMPGDKTLEADLHDRFRGCWDHGEWFAPDADLMEFIAAETITLRHRGPVAD
jgi:hypothetical protein